MDTLTPEERETLRRWAANPTIYTPALVSHTELLSRAVRTLPPKEFYDLVIIDTEIP